jgi:hypothetical protein
MQATLESVQYAYCAPTVAPVTGVDEMAGVGEHEAPPPSPPPPPPPHAASSASHSAVQPLRRGNPCLTDAAMVPPLDRSCPRYFPHAVEDDHPLNWG